MNENENMRTPNLWNSVKVVLKGRVIAIQAYLKEEEKNQIHNLTLQLKQLEKEEMRNHMEKEMATHSNILSWRIPGMEEPGGLPTVGLHRVGHN